MGEIPNGTRTVEIRCPVGPRRLLSKLRLQGKSLVITEGNLIEFSCDDCKRTMRKTEPEIHRVLHQYDLAGDLVQTIVE